MDVDNTKINCKYCGAGFDSRGRYNAHYRGNHQHKMGKAEANTVQRAENERFKCICSKEYKVYQSLIRHQRHCEAWQAREITQDEVELRAESESERNNQKR
jgi:hypothetical protein